MGWISDRSFVNGIKVQLEILVRILAVVIWIAKKSPPFQPTILHVVRDRCLHLIMIFVGRLARPLLYVLRIWPVWSIAVRNRFHMSGLVFPVKMQASLTCACHAKIDADDEVGLP